jgi:hypothetical protein
MNSSYFVGYFQKWNPPENAISDPTRRILKFRLTDIASSTRQDPGLMSLPDLALSHLLVRMSGETSRQALTIFIESNKYNLKKAKSLSNSFGLNLRPKTPLASNI